MAAPTRREWLTLALIVAGVGSGSAAWRAHRNASLGDDVAAAAAPGDIRMLSSVSCGVCTAARAWFTEHGVPFSECFIERDAACLAEFQASGAPGTPLMKVRGRALLGFSPPALLEALQRPG